MDRVYSTTAAAVHANSHLHFAQCGVPLSSCYYRPHLLLCMQRCNFAHRMWCPRHPGHTQHSTACKRRLPILPSAGISTKTSLPQPAGNDRAKSPVKTLKKASISILLLMVPMPMKHSAQLDNQTKAWCGTKSCTTADEDVGALKPPNGKVPTETYYSCLIH